MFKRVFVGAFLVAMLMIVCVESQAAKNGSIALLNAILVDPQYMALSNYQKLYLLEILYDIMEASYNPRMRVTSKQVG